MRAMAAQSTLEFGGSAQEIEVNKRRSPWPASTLRKRSCESREEERMLQLMMGSLERPPAAAAPPLLLEELAQRNSTLMDLQTGSKGLSTASTSTFFGMLSNADHICSSGSSPALELDSQGSVPLPSGWEKCLDLQTGCIYYLNRSTGLTTSCDPRTKSGRPTSSPPLNSWAPTSPSSSSDLTFEGIPSAAQAESGSSPRHAELDLDLSLSLRPSSFKRSTPIVVPSQAMSHAESTGLHDFMQAPTQGLVSIPRSCIPSTSTSSASSPCLLKDVLGTVGMPSKLTMQGSVGPSTVTLKGIPTLMSANACVEENSKMEGSGNDMMTVGCANCLMFVMVRHTCNPKCPRCGSSIQMMMTTPSKSARRSSSQPPAAASKRAKIELSLFLSSCESS